MNYEEAGVSTKTGAVAVDAIKAHVSRTNRPEVIGGIGGFGGLFSAATLKNMKDPILVSGTDGVGTKIKLADRLGKHDTVGIDLVAMCANDIVVCGAEPLFFSDYIAIGKLDPAKVSEIVAGIAEGCVQSGCALIGGEMAEHPGVMPENDYDLAGFCVGVVDRDKMIGSELVQEGDMLIGIASSGVHSNGFSLVRKALLDKLSDEELKTERESDCCSKGIGHALLTPTKIYVKPILSALQSGLPIHALAHITGGGITENLDRAMPLGIDAQVELGSWRVLPIFEKLKEAANLDDAEMLKTFNCGIGMVAVCAAESAADVIAHFESYGDAAYIIGKTVASSDSSGSSASSSSSAKGKVLYI